MEQIAGSHSAKILMELRAYSRRRRMITARVLKILPRSIAYSQDVI